MADEVSTDKDPVVEQIKDDASDSPEHASPKESADNQSTVPSNSNGTPKDWRVEIWLKQTGNAPILQRKKWCVPATFKIADVMKFVRKYMKLDASTSLFLYVNQAFAPCPDDEVGNVYQCFNMNGRLVLHYSTSPAWG